MIFKTPKLSTETQIKLLEIAIKYIGSSSPTPTVIFTVGYVYKMFSLFMDPDRLDHWLLEEAERIKKTPKCPRPASEPERRSPQQPVPDPHPDPGRPAPESPSG